jgi:hypothetical protein
MTHKESYRALCKIEKSIPIFSRDWWLDAVCGDDWDVCLVEKGGQIVATMPYHFESRYGQLLIKQPPLTQTLGPWLRPFAAKSVGRLGQEKELLTKLIFQLPEFSFFHQNWNYKNTNWLPFYWQDFRQTTRYTYVIEELADLDLVYANFSSSYRNKIKKASKLVVINDDLKLSEFYEINRLSFERQALRIPYSLDFLNKQDKALVDRNRRKIFSAKDSSGKIHSSIYLMWDDETSYVHMVGENPKLRDSGAGILLISEAIRFTAQVLGLQRFDFEGSMIEGVERVRRDCGAKQVPYFSITKTNSRLLRFAQGVRSTFLL